MKYLNKFNSNSKFNIDKETNKDQPRVALVEQNGGGVDTVHYIKFKIYEFLETSLINGKEGNFISVEDIPVKTTTEDIENDESIKRFDGLTLHSIYAYESYYFNDLKKFLTVTTDSLDLIDNGKLITKFTLTGLKRKDSDQIDFVGEIACYLSKNDEPILFQVDRTNSANPTVNFLDKNAFPKYMNNHEVEKRIKGIIIIHNNL